MKSFALGNVALLDCLPAPMLIVQGGLLSHINPTAARLLGGEPSALHQRPLTDFLPAKADQTPSDTPHESRWNTLDLTALWLEYTITPMEGGNPPALLFTLRDLTAQRAAEANTARLRRLLDTAPDAIYAKDREQRFTYGNYALLKMFGLERLEQILGLTDIELWGERAAFHMEPETRMMQMGEGPLQFEFSFTPPDQKSPIIHMVTKSIVRDENGAVEGMIGINRDITKLREQEDRLLERETQFHEAQLLAKLGTFITDIATDAEWWSDSLYAIYGLPPGTPTSRDLFRNLIHPDDRPGVVKYFTDAMSSGKTFYNLEHRIVQPSGQICYVTGAVDIRRDENGKPTKLIGVVKDVTDQHNIAESLREAQRFTDRILSLMPDSVFVFDIATRHTVYDSRDIGTILGYVPEQIAAMGSDIFKQLVHPEDYPILLDSLQQYEQLHDGQIIEDEVRYKAADGTWRWLYTRTAVFSRTSDGRVQQVVGVSSDVTEAHQQAEKIEQSESQYRLLAENIRDIILVLDENGQIEYISPTVETLAGLNAEHLIGKTPWSFIHPDDMPHVTADFALLETSPEIGTRRQELRVLHKNGSYIPCEAISTVLRQDGRTKIISSIRDIHDRKAAEDALRASEERLRFITDNMLDMVTVIEHDNVVYATPSHERIIGYKPSELYGKSFLDYLHPDDLPVVIGYYAENAQVPTHSYQYRFRKPNGNYIWLETVGAPTFNANGNIERIVLSTRDITERKQAEDALNTSQEAILRFRDRLRLLHEINIELSQIDDMDELAHAAVDWVRELIGVDRAGLFLRSKNRNIFTGTFGTDEEGQLRDEHQAIIDLTDEQEMLEHGKEEHIFFREQADLADHNKNKVGHGWHAVAFLKSQSEIIGLMPVDNLLTNRPLSLDDREVLALYAAMIGTLFARKQALDDLRHSEQRYRLLAQNVKDVIWTIDLTGRFTYVSPSVERLRGMTPEEVMAEPMEKSLTADSYKVAVEAFSTSLRRIASGSGVETHTFELEQPRKNGTTVWTEVTTTGLYNDRGDTIGILGVTRDISERRQTQATRLESERLQAEIRKEQELGKLKTAMMLRISHEFRTPLSVILSSADILDHYSEKISPERRKNHLDKIRSQVSHLTGIIDAIHLSVQGIFNRLEFRPQQFDLPALCREVIVEQKSRYHVVDPINLDIEGDNQIFSGDMNLIRLALQNTLSNALKFSLQGKPITIHLKITPQTATLEIRDQGIGIPDDELERVFEPFYRSSSIGEIQGLGIGLSIARDAAEAHRGELRLEHNPDGGIIAHLRFPNAAPHTPK